MARPSTRLALTGARVWDGLSEALSSRPQTILIDRGRITTLFGTGDLPAGLAGSVGLREISIEGMVALPGLIDAHVHLDLDPAESAPEKQLALPGELHERRMAVRARAMVRAGITSARDLGGGEWRELALRDRILRGELPGPRLLCAGQPVTAPGGHCHFWGGAAADSQQRARVVRRQLEHGAEWIKAMATGGRLTQGSSVARVELSAEALANIVELAEAAGRPVAAHCHGTEGIRNAVRAGVQSIEHCSFAGPGGFGDDLDEELVTAIARRKIWVSPTVNAGWERRIGEESRESDFFGRMSRVFRALRRAGVPLVASSDAGIPGVEHDRLARGLAVFARYAALTPLEALQSATRDSARALGLAHECGSLRPGLSADILVVEGDPLLDLGVLERPVLVVARGELVGPSHPVA